MATADEYAAWIVKNADKKGTPDFETVAKAYQAAKADGSHAAIQAQTDAWDQKVRDSVVAGMGGFDKFAAGAGKAVHDIGLGLGQRLGQAVDSVSTPQKSLSDLVTGAPGAAMSQRLGLPTQADVDQASRRDAPLMSTGAGVAGNITGNIMSAVPLTMIPGAASVPGAALVGGAMGFAQPTAAGESAGRNALVGGVLGGASVPVGNALGAGYRAIKSAFGSGNVAGAQTLGRALDMSPTELQRLMEATRSAPADLVPGSKLTFSQALQLKGVNTPGVKMLERTVAGGPGGDVLLQRYADQNAARMAALQDNGAQTYQGAAREEATRAGDKIGAVLRTQASDDQAAARDAWAALHGRAAQEGVALQLPLDQMTAAMNPLGRGTVGAGKDAEALLRTANEIGTDTAPGAMPTIARVGETSNDKTLGQAVRAIGIHPDELGAGKMGGEVRWLRDSLKGGRGIVNRNGDTLDHLAEKMYEGGYLDHPDPSELIQKLAQEAQGAPVYSNAVNGARAQYAAQGGDIPAQAGLVVPKAVPFDEFQRLRRSAGELSAKPNISGTEASVLGDLRNALSSRVDDAASGNLLAGEVMPQGFREQYNAARDMTRANAERYKQGNNIGSILRKPVGQDYALTGDEITNKLWHGGAGLAGDVSNLKNALSANNAEPVLNALRGHVMTDAASRVTASGQFGSALPKYVESRMPGLREAMAPEQLNALSSVAADIRNSEAAAAVPGLRGSDTQAKITRALDAGLLDSPAAKMVAKFASLKGIGGETIRAKLADMMVQNKGKTIAELLADPAKAREALDAYARAQSALPSGRLNQLAAPIYSRVPVLTGLTAAQSSRQP